MAKKAAGRRVSIKTLEELRAWILSFSWPGWDLTCMTYLHDSVSECSRHNSANYSIRLRIPKFDIELEVEGGTPNDVARKFQTIACPQIERAVRSRQEIENRRRIPPPPMKRLTHEKPESLLFP